MRIQGGRLRIAIFAASIVAAAAALAPADSISLGAVAAQPGGQARIAVNVSASSDLAGVHVCLQFDGTALLAPRVSPGPLMKATHRLTSGSPAIGTFNAAALAPTGTGAFLGRAGVAFYIDFDVSESASAAGAAYAVQFAPLSSRNVAPSGLTSTTGAALAHSTRGGAVTVNSLAPGALTVQAANGGESWKAGTYQTVAWSKTAAATANVSLQLFKGGALESVIAGSTPNDGSQPWLIPYEQTGGTGYKIKVACVEDPQLFDYSDGPFAIQASLPKSPPSLTQAYDNGAAAIHMAWTNSGADPWQCLGFSWDIYASDWVYGGWSGTLWFPYLPQNLAGDLPVVHSGGYHAWISNQYNDMDWRSCQNPWTGIIYSGTPHAPLDPVAQDLGGLRARFSWKPEIYGTWCNAVAAYNVALNQFVNSVGPDGDLLWHYLPYPSAEFMAGSVDLTLPQAGDYWLFVANAPWLPPYALGGFNQAFVAVTN